MHHIFHQLIKSSKRLISDYFKCIGKKEKRKKSRVLSHASPNASPKLNHTLPLEIWQVGQDLRQLIPTQVPGVLVKHHLLHAGVLAVLTPKLCHGLTHF